jgi:hypothetical protein
VEKENAIPGMAKNELSGRISLGMVFETRRPVRSDPVPAPVFTAVPF